jgi:hypothetical protein
MPPVFNRIAIFTLDTINDVTRPRLLKSEKAIKKGKIYVPEKTSTFNVCNPVFIGIDANDSQPENMSKHGIYRMKVYIDSKPFYGFTMNGFEFKYTKYINSFIAYDELVDNKITYIKTYREAGNKIPFYENINNNGLIVLKDTMPHNIRIELFDDLQNKSVADFKIRKSSKVATRHQKANAAQFITMHRNDAFEYYEDGLGLYIEPESLYSDALFKLTKTAKADAYSLLWNLGYENIPLHNAMKLKIKPVNLPLRLKEHAFIAKQNKDASISHCGGQFDADGFLTAEISSFGSYFISTDTIPPKVSVNAKNNNFSTLSKLTVSLSDNIPDNIESCNGYIDGKWVLFEHDPKTNSMTYIFDKKQMGAKGKKRNLKVIAADNCKNTTTFLYDFIY